MNFGDAVLGEFLIYITALKVPEDAKSGNKKELY